MKTFRFPQATHLLTIVLFVVPAASYAQAIDVSWTFGNVGSASYRLDAFTPANAGFGAIGRDRHSLGLFVKGVGQDHDGEIYVLASSALGPYGTTGVVLKIVGQEEGL